MKTDVYLKLRDNLDQMPVPFPRTASGIELELLKSLFTEEEALIACQLSAFPETAEKVAARLKKNKLSLEKVREKLDEMGEKGLIMARPKNQKGKKVYHKLPLAIGMFEFQVNRLNRKFAELFYAYEEEAFFDSLVKMKTHQMRTIPVNIAIEHQYVVGNYDDIRQIVKDSPGPFALMNCVCRQAKDLMEEPCRLTDQRETCITLEISASHMLQRGVARELSREELLKFLTYAKKEGLVLQPENIQHPTFICCCCGCCCGVLNSAVKYDRPADYIHSNFRSKVNPDRCDGCESCIDRCQMNAIKKVNGSVEILEERCIGCGVCIPVCKQRALKLIKKEKEIVPPVNEREMYKSMMMERFGPVKTVAMVLKSKVGMKV
jgi:electron transport complex protein RnfB